MHICNPTTGGDEAGGCPASVYPVLRVENLLGYKINIKKKTIKKKKQTKDDDGCLCCLDRCFSCNP